MAGDRDAPGLLVSLRRYWRSTLAVVVVVSAVTLLVSLTLPERYDAESVLRLSDPRDTVIFDADGGDAEDFERYTSRQEAVAGSEAVIGRAAEALDTDLNPLYAAVSADAEDVGLITIRARAGTAERAKEIADAVTTAYGEAVLAETEASVAAATAAIERTRLELENDIEAAEAQLRAGGDPALRGQIDAARSAIASLNVETNSIRINADAFNDGLEFSDPARLPTSPSEPQPLRNASLAALLSALAAGALAWVRADRHRRIDRSTQPAEVLGCPLLGTIPEATAGGELGALTDVSSPTAESYQLVTATMQYVFSRGILLVISAGRGEGRTVTAASVAAASARDGTSVVLVDADARALGLSSRLLGPDHARLPGLTDVLDGSRSVDRVLKGLELGEGVVLPFLSSGRDEADPASAFRSAGMAKVLAELREQYELIVVDTPALLAVADVVSLGTYADGILLVVANHTPLGRLDAVRERLAVVDAPLVGYVYTRVDDEGLAGSYAPEPPRRRWALPLLARRRTRA